VAAVIRQRIESGAIEPNRPVPSITGIVQEFGVARGTAVKALALLADEGLVRVVPGKGTFVTGA
jgi:GntR family transcriptional regulator